MECKVYAGSNILSLVPQILILLLIILSSLRGLWVDLMKLMLVSDGGMDLDFMTFPANGGTAGTPVVNMTLDVGRLGIGTTIQPPHFMPLLLITLLPSFCLLIASIS